MIPEHQQQQQDERQGLDELRDLLDDPAKSYFVNYLIFSEPEHFSHAFRVIKTMAGITPEAMSRKLDKEKEYKLKELRSYQKAAENNFASLLSIDPNLIRKECSEHASLIARRNEYRHYPLKELDCGKPLNLRRALAKSQSPEAVAEMDAEKRRRKLARRARGADGAADASPASGLGRRGRQLQQDLEGSRRRRQAGGRPRKYY